MKTINDQFECVKIGDERLILHDHKEYRTILQLIGQLPDLKNEVNLLAKLINFICQESGYEVIENPEEVKARYLAMISREQAQKDLTLPRSSSWGVFDVSSISTPHWEGDLFIFYAWNSAIRVPYRAVVDHGHCHYQLLPFNIQM